MYTYRVVYTYKHMYAIQRICAFIHISIYHHIYLHVHVLERRRRFKPSTSIYGDAQATHSSSTAAEQCAREALRIPPCMNPHPKPKHNHLCLNHPEVLPCSVASLLGVWQKTPTTSCPRARARAGGGGGTPVLTHRPQGNPT